MAEVILLHDPHQPTRLLLPWYANGSLDAAEAARVAAHLSGCAACRAALAVEPRLKAAVAALPADPGAGWAALSARIAAGKGQPRRRWLIAAQAAALVLAAAAMFRPAAIDSAPRYHALGATRQPDAGNIIVLFSPDTREAEMRGALRAAGARLVGGPTAADAWLLNVPAARRAQATTRLRAMPFVTLAEPIGPGA